MEFEEGTGYSERGQVELPKLSQSDIDALKAIEEENDKETSDSQENVCGAQICESELVPTIFHG